MAFHRPSILDGLENNQDDLNRRHEENDIPLVCSNPDEVHPAVAAALSGGPLSEAAELNAINEEGCRDAGVPDESIYAGVPQWDGPSGARVTPPIGALDQKIAEIRFDDTDDEPAEPPTPTIPTKQEVLDTYTAWRDARITESVAEVARQISEQRNTAQTAGTKPPCEFVVTLPVKSMSLGVLQRLLDLLIAADWSCDHNYGDRAAGSDTEFTISLS
ncbi:MAG: hypothetical protein WBP22_01705 [Candidatus Saccharimonas sp.]